MQDIVVKPCKEDKDLIVLIGILKPGTHTVLLMTRRRHLLLFKVKGRGNMIHFVVITCKHDTD